MMVDMNEESFEESSIEKSQNDSSTRAPKCRRCRNHNILSDLRGHKHQCKFKDCVCNKCVIVTDGQRQTAVRIALYRQQRNCEMEMKHNSQTFDNGIEGNAVWNGNIEEKSLENGYGKRKYHQSSDSGSNSPGSDLSSSAQGTKRFALDSPPTIQEGACAPSLPVPQEILTRAFPHYSAMVLDLVLKGCNGNVLHAIEIISQYDKLPKTTSMTPFVSSMPNSTEPNNVPTSSNMMPPMYKLNCMNGNYRYLVPPGMLPLNPFIFPGGPPPFGCVPPPPSSFPIPAEDSQHVLPNGQAEREISGSSNNNVNPKIEKANEDDKERERGNKGAENDISSCSFCGHAVHFGDRFCTNCTKRRCSN